MSDIYSAPGAELTTTTNQTEFGSLEKGIAGDYDLQFAEVLGEAWRRIAGFKGKLWLVMIAYIVVYMVIALAAGFLFGFLMGEQTGALVAQLVTTLLVTPLGLGLFMVGLHRSTDRDVRTATLFSLYGKIIPLFLTMLLMYLLILIGFILLVLPGIYLSIAYTQALPLVAEKNMSPWQALEASRKAVTKKWFTVFGIYFVAPLLLVISMLPLGIGLIWSVPWIVVVFAVVYRSIFGVEKSTLEAAG